MKLPDIQIHFKLGEYKTFLKNNSQVKRKYPSIVPNNNPSIDSIYVFFFLLQIHRLNMGCYMAG